MSLQSNNFDKEILKNVFYGLLLFTSLTSLVNEIWILFFPISILIFEYKFFYEKIIFFKSNLRDKKTIAYIWFPLIIVLLSYSNKLLFGEKIETITDYYASFLLLPLVLISAAFIQNNYLIRTFLVLILCEIIIGLFEYIYGIRSFVLPFSQELLISDKSLLYNSRIYGLSVSSSVFAVKLFCTLILLGKAGLKKRYFYIVAGVIILGIILTFNRAVILASLFMFFSYLFVYFIRFKFRLRKLFQFEYFNLFLVLILFVTVFHSEVYYQFSRGESVEVNIEKDNVDNVKEKIDLSEEVHIFKEEKELKDEKGRLSKFFVGKTSRFNASGRSLIWANYAWYIENNLIFGNGSDKLLLSQYMEKKGEYEKLHAHNSFLMLLSTNGLIITLLYIVWYFLLWKGKNFLIILSVLLYSSVQYGIFWGISFLDIVFVSLLISTSNFISIGHKATSRKN